MDPAPLRIAIIDDSALYRQMLLNVLARVPCAEVVGAAATGREGVELVVRTRPDVVTLDVQMPGMDGIEVLREFRQRGLDVATIMVSSLTAAGAPATVAALMEGAFDYVLKPAGSFAHENREQLLVELTAKIAAIQAARLALTPIPTVGHRSPPRGRYAAIAIGTSTGGPQALRCIVPQLPTDLPLPVFVVQHIPAEFSGSLAARLAAIARIPVVEVTDGMPAIAGRVYLAAGGRHLTVRRSGEAVVCRLEDGPPRKGCRPSFDQLLESLIEAYDGRVIAAVLTGMGRDGLEGCRQLAARGGLIVAEAASSCVVYGMPKAVIDAGLADEVAVLPEVAARLTANLGLKPPDAATTGRFTGGD